MSTPAEYCKTCGFPFKQTGACPMPGKSILWAYLSVLPYLLPLLVLLASLVLRSMARFKLFLALVSAYISVDKLVKNLIRSTENAK